MSIQGYQELGMVARSKETESTAKQQQQQQQQQQQLQQQPLGAPSPAMAESAASRAPSWSSAASQEAADAMIQPDFEDYMLSDLELTPSPVKEKETRVRSRHRSGSGGRKSPAPRRTPMTRRPRQQGRGRASRGCARPRWAPRRCIDPSSLHLRATHPRPASSLSSSSARATIG